jgi:hypothetical protein
MSRRDSGDATQEERFAAVGRGEMAKARKGQNGEHKP